MRMTQLLVRTLRDSPSDADIESHALLIRGGYIRRLTSGVYTFLPLGFRVLSKLQAIVREELDKVGMQEMLMPALSPLELWEESGRAALFGQDALPAMTFAGRGGNYVLGPTHEEVVTHTVGNEIESYRQLPVSVYQIQTKFRDEARPRFGLMRTRELIMCDAYSFDVDKECMAISYKKALDAYVAIFERVELDATPVEARSGAIGGDVNHEFMVPSAVGEDHFVRCISCGYAANVEAAEFSRDISNIDAPDIEVSEFPALQEHRTPGVTQIDELVEFFGNQGWGAKDFLKSMAVIASDASAKVILLPGDRELALPNGFRLFDDQDFIEHPELVRGYLGPVGLRDLGVEVLADNLLKKRPGPWVVGANRTDFHLSGAVEGRDFSIDSWGSYSRVLAGDLCSNCGAELSLVRSVEAAHTFQLGLTYSSKMSGAEFVSEDAEISPFWMGCYGIGVSRLMAVLAQEHHDERGLIWPDAVSPYKVHLLALGSSRSPDVLNASESLYAELLGMGISTLYDDRDVSPGVKFADADLLGMPLQLVVGGKGLARGVVELRNRRNGHIDELALDEVVGKMKAS